MTKTIIALTVILMLLATTALSEEWVQIETSDTFIHYIDAETIQVLPSGDIVDFWIKQEFTPSGLKNLKKLNKKYNKASHVLTKYQAYCSHDRLYQGDYILMDKRGNAIEQGNGNSYRVLAPGTVDATIFKKACLAMKALNEVDAKREEESKQ